MYKLNWGFNTIYLPFLHLRFERRSEKGTEFAIWKYISRFEESQIYKIVWL